ncbi:hypothetical protein K9M74_01540 [Candidatus Woesearchaeota archaeon]|nr:hypothetical protein [Candidatus Woesearchaeota archaeon]
MKKIKTIDTKIIGNNIAKKTTTQGHVLLGVEMYIENERKLVTYNPETKELRLATNPKNITLYFSGEEQEVVRVKTQAGHILEYERPKTINVLTEGKQTLNINSENLFTSIPKSIKQKVRKYFPN